jgi:hypothetical protein
MLPDVRFQGNADTREEAGRRPLLTHSCQDPRQRDEMLPNQRMSSTFSFRSLRLWIKPPINNPSMAHV